MSQKKHHMQTKAQSMLNRFVQAKRQEIADLEQAYAHEGPPSLCAQRSPALSSALFQAGPGAVIAEYKPASPSRGPIALDLSPEQAGELFVQGGSAAISVLTDSTFFGSNLKALSALAGTGLPLLRKDFLIDPIQVTQTAATPASAFLLITRLFARDKKGMHAVYQAGVAAGLEPVVEVFDREDVAAAKDLGAAVILVNSRDLDTLKLDLDLHQRLIKDKEAGELWICASGLSQRVQIMKMAELGYLACLIGTSIMDSPDRLAALRSLTGGPNL